MSRAHPRRSAARRTSSSSGKGASIKMLPGYLGVIEHSNSAYNSPLLFVKKSDGSLRPVIDFRQLNKATQFDAEPIPNLRTYLSNWSLRSIFLN